MKKVIMLALTLLVSAGAIACSKPFAKSGQTRGDGTGNSYTKQVLDQQQGNPSKAQQGNGNNGT